MPIRILCSFIADAYPYQLTKTVIPIIHSARGVLAEVKQFFSSIIFPKMMQLVS